MTTQEQREQIKNVDLGKTQITDKIRVSSAALHHEEYHGSYWLIETWIFSDDPAQENVQVIHGTPSSMHGEKPPYERDCATARRIHAQMVAGLRRKHILSNAKVTNPDPTKL